MGPRCKLEGTKAHAGHPPDPLRLQTQIQNTHDIVAVVVVVVVAVANVVYVVVLFLLLLLLSLLSLLWRLLLCLLRRDLEECEERLNTDGHFVRRSNRNTDIRIPPGLPLGNPPLNSPGGSTSYRSYSSHITSAPPRGVDDNTSDTGHDNVEDAAQTHQILCIRSRGAQEMPSIEYMQPRRAPRRTIHFVYAAAVRAKATKHTVYAVWCAPSPTKNCVYADAVRARATKHSFVCSRGARTSPPNTIVHTAAVHARATKHNVYAASVRAHTQQQLCIRNRGAR